MYKDPTITKLCKSKNKCKRQRDNWKRKAEIARWALNRIAKTKWPIIRDWVPNFAFIMDTAEQAIKDIAKVENE